MRLTRRNQQLLFTLIISLLIFSVNYLTKQTTTIPPFLKPSPIIIVTPSLKKLEKSVVIKVIDGDTIEIEGNKKVRYIGINTPETVDPRRKFECFGKEASEKNKELVLGKDVYLEKDLSETDKYGRLLRYVYLSDPLGTAPAQMINEKLTLEGYAYASSYPPDIKYQYRLKAAEKKARENKLGLWGTCNIKN